MVVIIMLILHILIPNVLSHWLGRLPGANILNRTPCSMGNSARI